MNHRAAVKVKCEAVGSVFCPGPGTQQVFNASEILGFLFSLLFLDSSRVKNGKSSGCHPRVTTGQWVGHRGGVFRGPGGGGTRHKGRAVGISATGHRRLWALRWGTPAVGQTGSPAFSSSPLPGPGQCPWAPRVPTLALLWVRPYEQTLWSCP